VLLEEEEEEKSLKPTDGLTKVKWKEELLPKEEHISLIPHTHTHIGARTHINDEEKTSDIESFIFCSITNSHRILLNLREKEENNKKRKRERRAL